MSKKRKLCLLCLDDYKPFLDTLEESLTKHFGTELKIIKAENPEEALDILEEINASGDQIAIILSDLILPEILGDEFLVRAHKAEPQAIKILMTGCSLNEESIKLRIAHAQSAANLFELIPKSDLFSRLPRSIQNALRKFNQ